MRRLTGLTLVVLALSPAAACVNLLSTRSGIQADPVTVERYAETVFVRYGIPVSEQVADGRVESGEFAVGRVWDADITRQRVDCDVAEEDALFGADVPMEMSVTLKITRRSTGTRVSLGSDGRTVPGDGQDSRRCRLADAFAQEILDAVADEFPGVTSGGAGTETGSSW